MVSKDYKSRESALIASAIFVHSSFLLLFFRLRFLIDPEWTSSVNKPSVLSFVERGRLLYMVLVLGERINEVHVAWTNFFFLFFFEETDNL